MRCAPRNDFAGERGTRSTSPTANHLAALNPQVPGSSLVGAPPAASVLGGPYGLQLGENDLLSLLVEAQGCRCCPRESNPSPDQL